MSIKDKVKSEGLKMGMKAMGKIMESPDRAEKVMKAVQGVQQARERVDETTAKLLNAGQLPSREDVKDLARQAGKLRRQSKKVIALLDDIDEVLDEQAAPAEDDDEE